MRKVRAVAVVLVFAFLLTGAAFLALWAVRPLLPAKTLEALDFLARADWEGSSAAVQEWFASLGARGPLFFVGFQIVQVLIAPIPGQLAGLAGGFVFGFGQGLFYTMIGLGLGSLLAMLLGRLFGERVVRRFVPPDIMGRFDRLITEGGLISFFMIFLLPALPDDAVCFLAGLTRLRLVHLWGICVAGRLPGMAVLTWAGAGLGNGGASGKAAFALAMLVSLVVWLFDEEIERLAKRALK